MILAYLLSSLAFIAGIGLNVTSGWLITMASFMPPVLTLSVAVVLVRFFGISRSIARYLERVVSHKSVFKKLADLRSNLYERIISNPAELVIAGRGGRLVKQVVDDVERVQEYELRVFMPGAAALITMFAATLLAFWLQPTIGLMWLALTFILTILIPIFANRSIRELTEKLEDFENKYSDQVRQNTHGSLEAELYGYLDQITLKTHQLENEINQIERQLLSKVRFFQFIINLILMFALLRTIQFAQSHTMPAVQVAMLVFLVLTGTEAVTTWYPNLFNSGKLSLARENLARIPKTKEAKLNRINFDTLKAEKFCAYWVQPELVPISFQLKRGEILVLRGPSGVGKTTTAMAIFNLVRYSGSLTINGKEIYEIGNLPELVAGALQNGHIFNTSLRENLKISGAEDFKEILELLELEELVNELPDGLDTLIGEYGRGLSGGEMKRIILARALLSNSPLLVLDEPTEHLDPELAERITQRIIKKFTDRAILVITHSGWGGVPQLTLERSTHEN